MSIMVAVGVSLSVTAFLLVRHASQEAERAMAERQAIQLRDTVKERLDRYGLLLHALSGPLAGMVPAVAPADFSMATQALLPLYPSLRAVAWAPRAPDAPERYLTTLVEPPMAADGRVGLDLGGSPERAALLTRSCGFDGVAAQEGLPPDDAATVTVLLPVSHRGGGWDGAFSCGTPAGYLWASFRLETLLGVAAKRMGLSAGDAYLVSGAGAEMRVLAAQPGGRERAAPFVPLPPERLAALRAAGAAAGSAAGSVAGTAIEHEVGMGGRSWRLLLVPPPSPLLDPRDRLAWLVLAVGLLLTGGLAAYARREAVAKNQLRAEARARALMGRALRDSEERFRLALHHSRVALYSQDRELRYLWAYSPQSVLLPENPIGRAHADLYPPEEAARLDAIKRPVLETGVGARAELPLTVGGQRRMFDLCVEPMRDEAGGVSGLICAAIDVTEATEIRQALADAHAEAERANQAKSRFLAAASHDLRQPFQAMSLFHHILLAKLTDPQQREIAAKLGEALTTGNALLSALLDTSALEVGSIQPRLIEFDIHDLMARLATEISGQAFDRGLTLRVVPCSARVRSDPILLERMLRNLLVNALRYTEEGRILLGCRPRGDRLEIEVWDTGPGIPEDQMSAIFEDFYRCGTDQRDSTGGLGLGLSIVRRTAQILDHPVTVRSKVGRGTVFAISVPLVPRQDLVV